MAAKTESPIHRARKIKKPTEIDLWVVAGGRCQFRGCNAFLRRHHLSGSDGNFAEFAHIVAFSENGARGNEDRPVHINDVSNLMLLCKPCHTEIDRRPADYGRQDLEEQKREHEARIYAVTEVGPEMRAQVLILKARIGGDLVTVPKDHVRRALAPYYATPDVEEIDLTGLRSDAAVQLELLRHEVDPAIDYVYRKRDAPPRVAVFGLAPIPALVYLGSRLSNKVETLLFQRHRDKEDWTWKESPARASYDFECVRAGDDPHSAVLLVALSGTIDLESLPPDIQPGWSVFRLTLDAETPSPHFLRCRDDLARFSETFREGLREIERAHDTLRDLHLIAAVPAPVAIAIGRERMSRVDPKLVVYDRDAKRGGYFKAVEVAGRENP